MRLVDDWRDVVSHSLSFWLQVAGLFFLIAPEVYFRWTGQDYDPYFYWRLSALLYIAGLAGRLLDQPHERWRERLRVAAVIVLVIMLAFISPAGAAPATEAQTLKVAVPFIAAREGKRLVAYQDVVGVWTICYGSTRGVHAGMVMTDGQCTDLLAQEVAAYRDRLHAYFTPATIDDRLPPTRDAAYTSLAYNCGVYSIGHSTAVRRLNAGNIKGGCEAITWWSKAGHRLIRGLFVRRKAEEALCLKD